MLSLDPFCSLTEAGKRAYEGQWASWLSREFTPEFLIFWVVCAYLYIRADAGKFHFPWLKSKVAIGVLAAFPVMVTLCVTLGLSEGKPHFEDEFSYLYQAEALARGVYPGLEIEEKFHDSAQVPNLFYNREGQLVGVYSLGYPLLLAPFTLWDLEWLGNWLIQAICVGLLFVFLYRAFGDRVPLVWPVVAFSPWMGLFPAWYFSQNLSLLLLLLILLRRQKEEASLVGDYFLAGALFLVRSPDGLIVFASLFLWILWERRRMEPALLVFFWSWPLHFLNQKWITGDWFSATYTVFSSWHKLGFGADIGILEPWGFSLGQALSNFCLTLLSLNDVLLGWPQLSLLPVLMGLWVLLKGAEDGRWNSLSRFCLLLGLIWFGLYFCYFYPGIAFGPRFHYPLIPLFFWLSGHALESFPRLRAPVALLLPYSVFALIQFSSLFRDAAGVIQEPLQRLASLGVDISSYDLVVIPSMGLSREDLGQYTADYRTLFAAFHNYNDLFSGEYRFIRASDFYRHEQKFREEYGDRILVLQARQEDVLKILKSHFQSYEDNQKGMFSR